MSYDWGPRYIVPSGVLESYSGTVRLREEIDEDLLRKELEVLNLSGPPRKGDQSLVLSPEKYGYLD